jgi:hypothetical protein
MRGAIPPLPQYVFMAWCLVKHRDNFTFSTNDTCYSTKTAQSLQGGEQASFQTFEWKGKQWASWASSATSYTNLQSLHIRPWTKVIWGEGGVGKRNEFLCCPSWKLTKHDCSSTVYTHTLVKNHSNISTNFYAFFAMQIPQGGRVACLHLSSYTNVFSTELVHVLRWNFVLEFH